MPDEGQGRGMMQLIRNSGGGGRAGAEHDRIVGGAARRGDRVERSSTELGPPLLVQPRGESGAYALLDAHAFRNAVCAYLTDERAPVFALVILKPATPDTLSPLGEAVLGTLRAERGDLAGCLEGALAVFVRTGQRSEVAPFIERVRQEWRHSGGGNLAIELATHPAEEDRIIDLLATDWAETDLQPLCEGLQIAGA